MNAYVYIGALYERYDDIFLSPFLSHSPFPVSDSFASAFFFFVSKPKCKPTDPFVIQQKLWTDLTAVFVI